MNNFFLDILSSQWFHGLSKVSIHYSYDYGSFSRRVMNRPCANTGSVTLDSNTSMVFLSLNVVKNVFFFSYNFKHNYSYFQSKIFYLRGDFTVFKSRYSYDLGYLIRWLIRIPFAHAGSNIFNKYMIAFFLHISRFNENILLSVPKFTANLYCICLIIDLRYT